jgi:hypothetical protein
MLISDLCTLLTTPASNTNKAFLLKSSRPILAKPRWFSTKVVNHSLTDIKGRGQVRCAEQRNRHNGRKELDTGEVVESRASGGNR